MAEPPGVVPGGDEQGRRGVGSDAELGHELGCELGGDVTLDSYSDVNPAMHTETADTVAALIPEQS